MTVAPTRSDEFEFRSAGLRLAGVVERPEAGEPHGSVLLLSGSGPQDRDESIAGKRPFAVLSAALAGAGWQVLRWDDRGVGASAGDYLAASASVLVDDVGSAMAALTREFGLASHALVGHSQGTLIAAAAAARFPGRVAGIALLAGMGLPGRRVLLDQHVAICRAEGWPEADIEASLAAKRAAFDLLAAAEADLVAGAPRDALLARLRDALESLFTDGVRPDALPEDQRAQLAAAVEDLLEWEWRFLVAADPADDLARVACPVFALTGSADTQVAARENLAAIEAAARRGPSPAVEAHLVDGLNHLLQDAPDGRPSDYRVLGEPFAAPVPALLGAWLRHLCDPPVSRSPGSGHA